MKMKNRHAERGYDYLESTSHGHILEAASSYPSGRADVVLLLKLLELPFLGLVLLGKASNDLAYLTREKVLVIGNRQNSQKD